jgi:glycerate 2-kinase
MMHQAIAMKALLAPDKFKGTLTAAEVAAALARGFPGPSDPCPVADGGEGTAAALLTALEGEWVAAAAHDALGRPIDARWARLADGRAVVEVAEASGLWRLDPGELDPIAADSTGTGELIAAAINAGSEEVLVACGGSATTDAGAGALRRFDPAAVRITCLCDVAAPFLGALDFAPQKGAAPEQLAELRERLQRAAEDLPAVGLRLPFTGAAGGLAGGLWARGARLVAGAPFVLGAVGFDERLAAADLCITGEGRLDATTLSGKVVAEIARRCRRARVPCHATVGVDALGEGAAPLGLTSVAEAGEPGELEAAATAIAELEAAGPPPAPG